MKRNNNDNNSPRTSKFQNKLGDTESRIWQGYNILSKMTNSTYVIFKLIQYEYNLMLWSSVAPS